MEKKLKLSFLVLSITTTMAIFTGCNSKPTNASDTVAPTISPKAPISVSAPTDTPVSTVAPSESPSPVVASSTARIDFNSAEHIAASKARLAKDYPDSFTTQKMLQETAVKHQAQLEDLVNRMSDSEWSQLKGSYTRLVNDYNDSPTTVFMLFQKELESFRSMK